MRDLRWSRASQPSGSSRRGGIEAPHLDPASRRRAPEPPRGMAERAQPVVDHADADALARPRDERVREALGRPRRRGRCSTRSARSRARPRSPPARPDSSRAPSLRMRTALPCTRGAPAAREKAWSAITRTVERARAMSVAGPGARGRGAGPPARASLTARALSRLAAQGLRRLEGRGRRGRVRLLQDLVQGEEPRAQAAQRGGPRGERVRRRPGRRARPLRRRSSASSVRAMSRATSSDGRAARAGPRPASSRAGPSSAQRLRERLAVDGQPHRVRARAAPTGPRGSRGVSAQIAAIG